MITKDDKDESGKNSWMDPQLNMMAYALKVRQDVNGYGSQMDQLIHYLEPQSVLHWTSIGSDESYVATYRDLPMKKTVVSIQSEIESRPDLDQTSLDVIALGPGDAHTEVSLIKTLLRDTKISKIRLYLLDISQPLLRSAGIYARSMFEHNESVSVTECNGDFYNLSQYTDLINISRRAKRMTLITMFGYTFGNLHNERSFLRSSLTHFSTNALFLMDVVGSFVEDTENKAKIKASDPLLNGESKYQKTIEQWISIPFRTYRKGLKERDAITFVAGLNESRVTIPGSYCVEILAKMPGAEFSVLCFKRYLPVPLCRTMQVDGWESVDVLRFGSNSLLHLFRKISA